MSVEHIYVYRTTTQWPMVTRIPRERQSAVRRPSSFACRTTVFPQRNNTQWLENMWSNLAAVNVPLLNFLEAATAVGGSSPPLTSLPKCSQRLSQHGGKNSSIVSGHAEENAGCAATLRPFI